MENIKAPVGGDRDRAPGILALTWTEWSISFVLVALRLITRTRITRHVGLDDVFIVITLFLILIFSIIWTFYASKGGCRHVYYLSAARQALLTKLNWISQPFCIMAIATGKVSVAFLILRILGMVDRWRRGVLYLIIYSVLVVGGVQCMLTFAQCTPTRALWTPSIALHSTCWSHKLFTTIAICVGAYFAAIDLFLALLPLTIIWTLQIPRKRKAVLGAVLGLGVFAAACAAIKTTMLPSDSSRDDFTWATVDLLVWNVNEINAIIVAACIPTLQPIVSGAVRRINGYRRSGASEECIELGNTAEAHGVRDDRFTSRKDPNQERAAIQRTVNVDVSSRPISRTG